ncbi:hypothetical protein QZH41_010249, partial [Actinostola sp. cb2023]
MLKEIVVQAPGKIVLLEELLSRLDKDIQGVRLLPRKSLVDSISTTLGTKVRRKGKKKEQYYQDFEMKSEVAPSLLPETSHSSPSTSVDIEHPTNTDKSPVHKQRVMEEPRTCRGKLSFTDVPEQGVFSELATQIDDLEISTADLEQGLLKEYQQLQAQLHSAHLQVQELTAKVTTLEYEKESLNKTLVNLEAAFNAFETQANSISSKQDDIINLYKEILDSGELIGGLLSLSERNTIREEIKKVEVIFNIGLKTNEVVDLLDKIHPSFFNQMVEKMKKGCPLITNILEQLVLTSNASRNKKKTVSMKMKASVHLLSSLMDVRNQKAGNDIPLLFGLLCLCYGAGPSMIEVLQHLGLSESFPELVRLLKKQLENYKKIIHLRVSESNPVITYQDNMQVKRTSMRHLRLSKLQKSKVKQGKMWDFTVRGWRAADITGIEDMFDDPVNTSESQKDVSKLKYEDTKI